jgi:hypothetical protein
MFTEVSVELVASANGERNVGKRLSAEFKFRPKVVRSVPNDNACTP